MLKLTKKADYGLIAMRHLAEHSAVGTCSAKDLAELYSIPQEALAKILQRLKNARLLKSLQGTNGGYVLARDAREITALEVIRAIEGPLSSPPAHNSGRVRAEHALHRSRAAAQGQPHDRGCPGKVDGLGFDRNCRAGFGE